MDYKINEAERQPIKKVKPASKCSLIEQRINALKLKQEEQVSNSTSKPPTPKKPSKPSQTCSTSRSASRLKPISLAKPPLVSREKKEQSPAEKLSSCRARLTSPGALKQQLKPNPAKPTTSVKTPRKPYTAAPVLASKPPSKPPKPSTFNPQTINQKRSAEVGTVFKVANNRLRNTNNSSLTDKSSNVTNKQVGCSQKSPLSQVNQMITDAPPLMTKCKSRYNSGDRRTSGLAKVNRLSSSSSTSNHSNNSNCLSPTRDSGGKQDCVATFNYPKSPKPSIELLKSRFSQPNISSSVNSTNNSACKISPAKSPKIPSIPLKLKNRFESEKEESMSSHRPRQSTTSLPAPCLQTPETISTNPLLPIRSPTSKSTTSSNESSRPSSHSVSSRPCSDTSDINKSRPTSLNCKQNSSPHRVASISLTTPVYDSLEEEEYEEKYDGPKKPVDPCPSQRPTTIARNDTETDTDSDGEIYEVVEIGNQLDNEHDSTAIDIVPDNNTPLRNEEDTDEMDNFYESADLSGDNYESISDVERPPSRQANDSQLTVGAPHITIGAQDKSPNIRHVPLPATPHLSDSVSVDKNSKGISNFFSKSRSISRSDSISELGIKEGKSVFYDGDHNDNDKNFDPNELDIYVDVSESEDDSDDDHYTYIDRDSETSERDVSPSSFVNGKAPRLRAHTSPLISCDPLVAMQGSVENLSPSEQVPALPPRKANVSGKKGISPARTPPLPADRESLYLSPLSNNDKMDAKSSEVSNSGEFDNCIQTDRLGSEVSEEVEDSYYLTPVANDHEKDADVNCIEKPPRRNLTVLTVQRSSSLNVTPTTKTLNAPKMNSSKESSSSLNSSSTTTTTASSSSSSGSASFRRKDDNLLSQIYDVFKSPTTTGQPVIGQDSTSNGIRRCISDVKIPRQKHGKPSTSDIDNENDDYDLLSTCSDPRAASGNIDASFTDSGVCSTSDEKSYNHSTPANSDCLSPSILNSSIAEIESRQSDVSITRSSYVIIKDLLNSEAKYVCDLKLINNKFSSHFPKDKSKSITKISKTILQNFPTMCQFNEAFLDDLTKKFLNWEEDNCIAEVFIKKGPFLKIYNSYINQFYTMSMEYESSMEQNAKFRKIVESFQETYEINNLMDLFWLPVKRVPEYYAILQEYKCSLHASDKDFDNTTEAINIIREVQDQAWKIIVERNMSDQLLNLQKMLKVDIIKPARNLIKDDIFNVYINDVCEPRRLLLMNDAILCCVRTNKGYKLKQEMSISNVKIQITQAEVYPFGFTLKYKEIIMKLAANSEEEREIWTTAVGIAKEEYCQNRDSLMIANSIEDAIEQHSNNEKSDKTMVMPVWIPDKCVTMCQLCTVAFTLTYRRHHCRVCGKVVCTFCSKFRIKIGYMDWKMGRVCEKCYINVTSVTLVEGIAIEPIDDIRKPFAVIDEKISITNKRKERAKILKLPATCSNADLSGYLKIFRRGKWKQYWCVVKDMALYKYRASEDSAAKESIVLLSYKVLPFKQYFEGIKPELLFKLSHSGNVEDIIFQTDSDASTKRWMEIITNLNDQ